ncbi:MAG: hypothetical protein IJ911_08235 [Salinivirgaceae bacterium]|nr:hypothetical protein [Salinivirgaceae bacterium]
MKHILFICLLAVYGCTTMAQNHQTFKGVPIDGKTGVFVNQLKQKGFHSVDDSGILNGSFAGYDDCEVSVLSSAQTGNVYGVRVQIPMCRANDDFRLMIYDEYKKLQAALTEKYGEPVQQRDSVRIAKEDDFVTALLKLIADVKETFEFPYSCVFDTGLGNVLLNGAWIASDCGGGYIIMTYIDKVNNEANRKAVIDDL